MQLTSDGHKPYLEAVEGGAAMDYAMLVKVYGQSPEAEKRYSPAECIGCHKTKITGNPDPDNIVASVQKMCRFVCPVIAIYARWGNVCVKEMGNDVEVTYRRPS